MNATAGTHALETRAAQAQRSELSDRIMRCTGVDGVHPTSIPRLQLIRNSRPGACMPVIYEPRLCIVAQGSKIAMLAGETYRYDPLNYLVVSTTLPMAAQIVEASPAAPYLCLRLDIDVAELRSLILDSAGSDRPGPGSPVPDNRARDDGRTANGAKVDRMVFAERVNAPLLDAVMRLVRLLDAPADIAVLAPLALREVFYRVLAGDLGRRLRDIASVDSSSHRIGRALTLLRERYAEPLSIEALAESMHMSVSALHHQFKAATAMSPLQYQKRLRLHEARRLMLADGIDAASAAHRVGYESPSQFSREYKRLFGAPPRTEIAQVRAALRA